MFFVIVAELSSLLGRSVAVVGRYCFRTRCTRLVHAQHPPSHPTIPITETHAAMHTHKHKKNCHAVSMGNKFAPATPWHSTHSTHTRNNDKRNAHVTVKPQCKSFNFIYYYYYQRVCESRFTQQHQALALCAKRSLRGGDGGGVRRI